MLAAVPVASRISMVDVVLNFATARGSCRKTWRGVPIARSRMTIELARPLCSAAAPTLNIRWGHR
ncbi:hypothetical protein [Blastococcus brunescens]|uniref:Uncharacterized protein n=1 Tax=Blastococcus brunescens TaxID=1564165 RepID=A0ABZ1B0Z7_9ACTN|nr:hypothetical protein [Blastococcus sp. BMG 8361]WRL63413.1 hypothetical protein U6N30_27350 [Blastococcus sp. BMG 8361]